LGHKIRCYVLEDGRRILNAEDIDAFFGLDELEINCYNCNKAIMGLRKQLKELQAKDPRMFSALVTETRIKKGLKFFCGDCEDEIKITRLQNKVK